MLFLGAINPAALNITSPLSALIFFFFDFYFSSGMTPSPEKKNLKNNILQPRSIERTVEKYGQYQSGGQNDSDIESEEDDDEEEEEEVEDDEDDIGVLNISNHDINDRDEMLQSDIQFATPTNMHNDRSNKVNKNTDRNILRKTNENDRTDSNRGSKMEKKTVKNNLFYDMKNSSPIYSPTIRTPNSTFGSSPHNKLKMKSRITKALNGIQKNEKSEKNYRVGNTEKNENNEFGERIVKNERNQKNVKKLDTVFMESVSEVDLVEISEQIKLLNNELKFYEEISGKRSLFNTEVNNFSFCEFFLCNRIEN